MVLNKRRDVESGIRALLREVGLKVSTPSRKEFSARVRELAADDPVLTSLAESLLSVVAVMTQEVEYDQEGVSTAVAQRHSKAAVIVPPRSTAVPSKTAATAPTQRDRHLQSIAKHGRAAWQKASGYMKRARAETTIGRFKQVIGDGLRSRTDERRATEVNVAVRALNRMLEFGRPIFVRIA